MKCSGCGAELAENAKKCDKCGREVGMGKRAAEETMHVGKEAGEAAEKVGKGIWGGVKKVGSGVKKEIEHKHDDSSTEPKSS